MKATPLLVAIGALAAILPASAHADAYRRCPTPTGATLMEVARTTCSAATPAAVAVAAAPAADAGAALRSAGWTPTRAETASGGFDVVALRGKAALRVRRPGATPDLDGWEAGRELIFTRGTIAGGQPIPDGSAACTSAFLIHLSSGGTGGLSAAHCGGVRSDGLLERAHAAMRRPPQPGIVLGRVRGVVQRKAPLDALVLPIPSGASRPRSAIVDRGVGKPPWIVAGSADATAGRSICLTGRTSGADQCGQILGLRGIVGVEGLRYGNGIAVVCTTIEAREGDSGGPVYTRARKDGTVRAIGLTTLAVGGSGRMCFTPIKPVLRTLGATIVTG